MSEEILRYPGRYVLGSALRELRDTRSLSLRGLAQQMDIGPSTLAAWETGQRQIPAGLLGWILGLLHATPTESRLLLNLHEKSERTSHIEYGTTGVTRLQRAYDRCALRTYAWAPRIVPDLLQTTAYAHRVVAPRTTGPDQIDETILTRHVRQLDHNPHHRHILLLGETALTLGTVPPEIIQSQLRHLTAPGYTGGLAIRIVPALFANTIEPFTVYETADSTFTVVLRHEHTTTYLSDPATVRHYRRTFGVLEDHATDHIPLDLQHTA